jgi:hypothetical protein
MEIYRGRVEEPKNLCRLKDAINLNSSGSVEGRQYLFRQRNKFLVSWLVKGDQPYI